MKNQNSTKHGDLDLSNVDHVSSNMRSSRFGAVLYVFEDNEAVILMIIKRQESNQIRYIDTKDLLADI